MADINIKFDDKPSESLQTGDLIFYTPTSVEGSYNTNNYNANIIKLGILKSITETDGKWELLIDAFDYAGEPTVNDYFFFVKNNAVNTSGLKGYYSEVKLKNDSVSKAELFSVSTGITESSK